MTIVQMLTGICALGATLFGLAAIILYGIGRGTNSSGAQGEAMMIGCIIAAAAFSVGAIYITANQSVFTAMGL